MEIINAHVHMIEFEALAERQTGQLMPGGIAVYENIEASLPLLLPRTLLAQMDEAGIDKSIIYAVEAPVLYASNEYVKSLCDKYPDRLIGFASVDPKSPDATKILERAIKEMGLKGLKFHPPLQDFFPNDKNVFPVYEKALELDIPVVFHVGTTPFGNMCKLSQANPLLLDDVANQFPDLRIMLTHLSTLWHNEAFMVVEKHPNVFIDTAAYLYEIPQILNLNLIKRLGADKVIFGTDYPNPFAGEPHRMKDFVDCIMNLNLPREVSNAIFYENVKTLLNGRNNEPKAISIERIIENFKFISGSDDRNSKDR
jgi:predicted TIM-barrel fold metal-dependent hydrolase